MRPGWSRLALRSLVRTGRPWPHGGLGWPRQEWPGVAKLLIRFRLVPFRSIPCRPNLIRAFSPHWRRELKGYPYHYCLFWSFRSLIAPLPRAVVQECAGVGTPHTLARYGPIWPDLPLAARTRVCNPHTIPSPRGRGDGYKGRDARFLPSQERRGYFAATTHVNNVATGGAMAQWAVVVGAVVVGLGGWAYVWGGVTLGPFANGPYIQTVGLGCEVIRLRGERRGR